MSNWLFVPTTYVDTAAIRFNGTTQYAYRSNPDYQIDTDGGFSQWVRFPALLTAQGTDPIFTLNVLTAGNDSSYIFSMRRNTGYGNTNNYIDITYRATNGGTNFVKSGSTAISANIWYNIIVGGDGKIYLNGVEETYQYWAANHFTAGWFSGISGATHDIAFGGARRAGASNGFGQNDQDNTLYLPGRSFTAAEALEIYSQGQAFDPHLLSMYPSLSHGYLYENNANDFIGSENLTSVGTPTYVAP